MSRSVAIIVLSAVCATAIAAERDDAYASANLPALSREWHGSDYEAVAAAIDARTISLPMFSSKSGAAILNRMTSTENLGLAQDKRLPIGSRFQEILTIGPAALSILRAYLVAANRGEKVNAELAALIAFQLHLAATQSEILEEFVPTIPRDEKYGTRMDGLRRARSGLTDEFLGATTSLSETQFYSADDISLMLQAMADALPSMKNLFAPDFRSELRNKLEAHRKGATKATDRKNLERMLAELT